MNSDDFRRILRETLKYHTDPAMPRSLADRMFGRWSFWYYILVMKEVVKARRVAASQTGYTPAAWARNAHGMLLAAERCGGRVQIEGLENIADLKTARVYVSNHMSMMETFLLPGILLCFEDNLSVVVKESLLAYPMFGKVLRGTDPISVTRSDPRQDLKDVLTKGEQHLRSGRSVLIFPQATRNTVFNPEEFNSLGVKLARRAGVQVVPVALKTDFQGNGRILKDFGPIDQSKLIRFSIGRPLSVEGTGKEAHEECVKFIAGTLKEWGGEVESRE